MVAGHQVNQCIRLTSSGPSQLELVVIDWIRQWVGYPEGAGGLLTSGGSVATITALVAAREAAGGHTGPLTAYMSDQSHSAQIRAARIVGVRVSVQTFGMKAFRSAVSKGMDLAAQAEDYVRASPTLEMLTPTSLGIVCLRVNPANSRLAEATLHEINRDVLASVFWGDRAFISSTMLHGRFSLRLCILNHTTTWNDVRETLEAIERYGEAAVVKHRDKLP